MADGLQPIDLSLHREHLRLSDHRRDAASDRGSSAPALLSLPATPTRLCAGALLLMMAAFVLVKTARDALYFTSGGIETLPHAYLGIATMSLPFALLTAGLMRLAGARVARVLLPVISSVVFLLLPAAGTPQSLRLTAFFMLVPLLFGLMFSTAWLLAGELLEGTLHEVQVEAYRWIGAASILGGTLGGVAARALAGRVSPTTMLVTGCATLLASAAVMAWTQSRRRTPAETERMESRMILAGAAAAPDEAAMVAEAERGAPNGAGRVARFARRILAVGREPYVGRLVLVGMMGALTGVLVEFLFYLIAASAPRTMGANARFFANAYLVMNASALLLQVLAFRPMQRRVGITGMLMALPLVLFGGAAALLAGLAMTIGSGLRIAEGGVKQSLHRSSWEQAFLPVKRADRGLAKLIVDGAGARIAEGLAAALLVLWIHFGLQGRAPSAADARAVVAALVVATLTWLLLANALRRETVRHAAAHPEDRCRPDSPLPDG